MVAAQDVLQSALNLSQASAHRDLQMEADILYCTGDRKKKKLMFDLSLLEHYKLYVVDYTSAGMLGGRLISMQKTDPKKVLEAFSHCILFHHSLSHNLL